MVVRDEDTSDIAGEVGRVVRWLDGPACVFVQSGLFDDRLISDGAGALVDDERLVVR
jgi:hypothetical protein